MAKIVLIGPVKPYRGGISHFNNSLIYSLEQSGHEVQIISWNKRYPAFLYPGKSQFDETEAHIVENDPKFLLNVYNPFTWFKTRKIISGIYPDILILNWVTPFLSLIFRVILGAKAKNKLLICHNVLPHESRFIDKELTKLVFKHSDHFIVHAEQEAVLLQKLVSKANFQTGFHPIYSFFAKKELKWNLREKYSLDKTVRCLLYFGYIRKYKGVKDLIHTMKLLNNRNNDTQYHLFIVGEIWEGREEIHEQISNLRLACCITVVNTYIPDDEVSSYFKGADLIVLPYLAATQSGVAQIAFSFDMPIVTTNVGGLKELDKYGGDVTIVEPGNPKAIQEAIINHFNRKSDKNIEQTVPNDRSWVQYVQLIHNILGK